MEILGNGTIINSYSTGEISGNNAEKTSLGMIIGINVLGSFENVYYLRKGNIKGIGAYASQNLGNDEEMAKTEEQMKSEDFVTLLNQQESSNWLKDETGINNGYPILKLSN